MCFVTFSVYKVRLCFLQHSINSSQIMTTKRKFTSSNDQNNTKKRPTPSGHWAHGLLSSMEDPSLLIRSDDRVVVIKDKYPKAEHHYLVLPKDDISSLKSVTSEHVSLLSHMDEVSRSVANDHENYVFKLGYHAAASMQRLHLHVISDDMNSPALKTKKHWNSFNTEFFIDSKVILKELEEKGKITLPSATTCKKLLDTPLQCHKCSFKPKNMPDLKKHVLKHITK